MQPMLELLVSSIVITRFVIKPACVILASHYARGWSCDTKFEVLLATFLMHYQL